ncbi:MAG TPA: SDR family oxidoreductase [Polyangiales bacterium]|jgi:NAD(P)-dependent dehydrogenase (short-subunit alcohol dehydrogenase family)
MFDLTGKVAIVTGALGLLGRQHCECLARAGANVVAVDLDDGACARFAAELSARHGRANLGRGADIVSEPSLLQLRAAVLARFDKIDVLVNNAALDDKVPSESQGPNRRAFEHFPLEAFRRSLEVNVTGTFLACQVLGTPMAQRGAGSIINVASTYGLVGPDQRLYREPDGTQTFFKSAAYPTSKGALLAFTRFLATYWGERQVRVNALCPGGVKTDQAEAFVHAYAARTPLGRMAEADDYQGAIVFLASDASDYMTGSTLVVDGGFTAW